LFKTSIETSLKPVLFVSFSISFWLMLMKEEISVLPLNEKKENKHFCFKKRKKTFLLQTICQKKETQLGGWNEMKLVG
jgi:hypothetical protein